MTTKQTAGLPTSRDFPEQFAAGMHALLNDAPPAPDSLVVVDRRPFRAGDVVTHPESGEDWVLACDEHNGEIWACGWPETRVKASTVELVEGADYEDRLKMLRSAAASDGPRGELARAQLATALASQPADPFDTADYYDCGREPDRLTHTTPLAAILAVGGEEHDPITASEILNACPITVAAYRHTSISDKWFEFCSRHLANEAGRLFEDEEGYGNPTLRRGFSELQVDQFAAALEPTVRAMMADIKPWHCEQVATREYSAEQVEAMLLEAKPEWFSE